MSHILMFLAYNGINLLETITMNSYTKIAVAAFILASSPALYAKNSASDFDMKAQAILIQHYQKYKDLEYFSGGELSIYIPHQKIKNYYTGQISHAKNSSAVSANTLFQIGSITKSFTAAVILQLEKEG